MPTMDRERVQSCWIGLDVLVQKPDCGTVLIEALGSTAVPTVKMPAFSAAVSSSISNYWALIKDPVLFCCGGPARFRFDLNSSTSDNYSDSFH